MFKGKFTAGTYTSGNLPITQTKNTNEVFELRDGEILIKKTGIVDVKANIVVTVSGTTLISAKLYGNGSEIGGAIYSVTPVDGSTYTLTINDAVLVESSSASGYAKLGIQLSRGATIVDGNLVCEYRQ